MGLNTSLLINWFLCTTMAIAFCLNQFDFHTIAIWFVHCTLCIQKWTLIKYFPLRTIARPSVFAIHLTLSPNKVGIHHISYLHIKWMLIFDFIQPLNYDAHNKCEYCVKPITLCECKCVCECDCVLWLLHSFVQNGDSYTSVISYAAIWRGCESGLFFYSTIPFFFIPPIH